MTDPREPITLSPAARARREAMLSDLKRAVRARRHRRHALQGVIAAAPLVMVAAVVLVIAAPRSQPTPTGVQARDHATDTEVATPHEPTFTHVAFSTLTDEELLEQLRAAGYDAGIARLGSRVVVTGLPAPQSPAPDQRPGPGAAAPTPPDLRPGHSV